MFVSSCRRIPSWPTCVAVHACVCAAFGAEARVGDVCVIVCEIHSAFRRLYLPFSVAEL